MKPTVGRIVYFYFADTLKHVDEQGKPVVPQPVPGIVTRVYDEGPNLVDLILFTRDGYGNSAHKVIAGNTADVVPGGPLPCWTWPPRE
jgi:hypothetical protein